MSLRLRIVAVGLACIFLASCGSDSESISSTTTVTIPGPPAMEATVKTVDYREDSKRKEKTFAAKWTRDGGYKHLSTDDSESYSFDAKAGSIRTMFVQSDGSVIASENVNATRSQGRYVSPVFDKSLATWVMSQAGSNSVTSVQHGDRDAWSASIDIPSDKLGLNSPDHADVVVDKETGITLSERKLYKGKPVWTSEVLQLRPIEMPADISMQFPADAKVDKVDSAFTAVTVAELSATAGYNVPQPKRLPDGYELTGAWVHKGNGSVSGAEGMNPVSVDQATLIYSKEWSSIAVNFRRTGDDPNAWADPYGAEGVDYKATDYTPKAGPFTGARGEMVTTPGVYPHAWAVNSQLVVDISGPLTTDQMVAALESLSTKG